MPSGQSCLPYGVSLLLRPRSVGFQPFTAEPVSVMLVGAGRRGLSAHVPALTASQDLRLTAIVETPERLAALRGVPDLDVPMHDSLASGVAASGPQLAIVATPHDSHVLLSRSLLEAGIPTLVEKPPARNAAELRELMQTSRDHRTPLATVLPLYYKPKYQHFARLLRSPNLTDASICIHADVPSWPGVDNWRLSREHAGGGVLIDLGYHYLDLLLTCLGQPDGSYAQLRTRAPAGDAVEDEAAVSLWFHSRRLEVSIRVRSGAELRKRNELLVIKNDKVIYSSSDPPQTPASGRAALASAPPPGRDTLAQIDALLSVGFLSGRGEWHGSLRSQLQVLSLVDNLYATADHVANFAGRIPSMSKADLGLAMNGGDPVSIRRIDPVWPRITDELTAALITQAHQRISIYDRSGVVRDFEDAFAEYIGVPRAIATSSGTAALHSLYYGAGIGPGDEVICSDYGFFATITPLIHLGARPVLVDCARDGTISTDMAEAAITGKTKAIMATHMWDSPPSLTHCGPCAIAGACCCSRTARTPTARASRGRSSGVSEMARPGASRPRRRSGPARAEYSAPGTRPSSSARCCSDISTAARCRRSRNPHRTMSSHSPGLASSTVRSSAGTGSGPAPDQEARPGHRGSPGVRDHPHGSAVGHFRYPTASSRRPLRDSSTACTRSSCWLTRMTAGSTGNCSPTRSRPRTSTWPAFQGRCGRCPTIAFWH